MCLVKWKIIKGWRRPYGVKNTTNKNKIALQEQTTFASVDTELQNKHLLSIKKYIEMEGLSRHITWIIGFQIGLIP